MITFLPFFTAIKYPGYFWNVKEKKLYSLKPSGELRPLPLIDANRHKHGQAGYRISVNGKRKYIYESTLYKLKLKDSEIPVRNYDSD